ncbi:hypothetical protein HDV01_003438 [Terramyces sp. JEL0728]|nr:hypothetical protein HDV01_003438 [Terramyces sp. JEL0728]
MNPHEGLYLSFRQSISNLIDRITTNQDYTLQLQSFTFCLEQILTHGFIDSFSFLKKKTLWEFISSIKDELIDIVSHMSDDDTVRVQIFIKMCLMRSVLATHLNNLYSQDNLSNWYDESAFMRNLDMRSAVLGLLDGLNKLEFNIYIKEEPKKLRPMKSITDFGSSLLKNGDYLVKSGINVGINVFDKVQHQVKETGNEILKLAQVGASYLHKDKDPQIEKLEQTILELIQEKAKMTKEYEELQKQKMQLEVEMIGLKMSRDKEVQGLRNEIAKLQKQNS